jgi:hypothetical protein
MTDFANKQGPYRTWSDPQREHVIKSLCGIIKRYTLGSFAHSVSTQEYDALDPKSRRDIGSAAFICADYSMWKVARRLTAGRYPTLLGGRKRDVTLAYFFETGTPGFGEIHNYFSQADWREDRRVQSLSVVTKTESPEVQAADILAYETGKHVQRHAGLHSRPIRRSLENLLKEGSHDGTVSRTRDHLLSILERPDVDS